ncbi:MAG: hypothetical protein Q8Q52_02005 [Acidimicrobiia bacterium]|nr:hypothetical protein [Acidimicrobiia bacterium]
MDLVVDLDEGQALSAIDALVKMGLRPRVPVNPRDFANRSAREAWIRDRGMQVFSMFDPSNPMRVVDLFVDHPVRSKSCGQAPWRRRRRATMTERAGSADRWDATLAGARKQFLESTLAATPEQRLAWLEEMLELAHRAGAGGKRPSSND